MPLNSHWLVLRIGATDFLHCWVANSIWLERVGSLITTIALHGGLFRAFRNFIVVLPDCSFVAYIAIWPASSQLTTVSLDI